MFEGININNHFRMIINILSSGLKIWKKFVPYKMKLMDKAQLKEFNMFKTAHLFHVVNCTTNN